MPCTVECSKCRYVFAEWKEIPPPQISRHEQSWYNKFYRRFRGRCPRCKHKLPRPEGYAEKMKVKIVANG